MPGVPYEMKGMMQSAVINRLEEFKDEEKVFLERKILLN